MRRFFTFVCAICIAATSFADLSYNLNGKLSNDGQGIVTVEADGYVCEVVINQGNTSNTPTTKGITYYLNGGVTNDDNWLTKNDMFQACMADCGVTGLASLDELKTTADPFITICTKLTDVSGMLNAEKWDWLEAYVMNFQNGEAGASALVEGTSSAAWRYALAAFFLESQRTGWPKSANFSHAGTPEAFMPAWKHGFANPTEPIAEFVLNAPYLEGKTFDGWYAAADFSGDKVTTVDASTTGTLYAKWIDYVSTVAEVRALADNTEAKTAGVVNFISGKNVYIQDATAGILVYTNETPFCKVGDKITVKGVKTIYGGAPEVKNAVIESIDAASVTAPTVFETLTPLLADSIEFKYFATNVKIEGLTIVALDSYNNPTVQDALGNQALCYKMSVNPTVYSVGTKVTITAVAGWYNGFQFVGDAKNIVIPVASVKENYTYPVREGKYTLENNWVISNMEDNFAANKPGSNDFVRGMAAKDGKMYFINRETMSIVVVDGKTGNMLDPIKLQGTDTLFKSQTVNAEGETVWADSVTIAYNDIKFDQAGNCLIGACTTGATKCQTFYIYIVDLETGVCTKLIEDVLWDNPGLDQVQFRFDAFGVAGNVTKNGVIMAADANGSWNVYRWLIEDGVAGEGEQVAVILDPYIDQSLFIHAAGYGTAPQIFPQDELGELFYVDGFNTLPMLFYGNPDEGAILIDDFINVPTGTKVWNNPGDTIAMNASFNGLVEFQVGEEYFLLMVAMNNVGTVPVTYALYKFADADRMFEGMEPLWYFPHNGLGTATLGCRTAVPSVEVVDDHTAKLYLYTVNNGYAAYTLTTNGLFVDDDDDEAPEGTVQLTVQSSNPTRGTVSGSGTYEPGQNVMISATPKTGYHFTQWNDGVKTNPRMVVVDKNTTYTAYFAPNQYTIYTYANYSDRGTTSGDVTADYMDYVTISATAYDGYQFTKWSDGNTNNPRTIQVTGDMSLMAVFEKASYNVTVLCDPAHGYVVGPKTAQYMETITLEAIPYADYVFLQWSDDNTDNPRTITVTEDIVLSAEFIHIDGQCGDNLYWSYNAGNTTLSIYGYGDMYDYTEWTLPWKDYTHKITHISLPEGMTSIGTSAFADCKFVSSVTIPASVEVIQYSAFENCRMLANVHFAESGSLLEIGHWAFYNCHELQNVTIPEGVMNIGYAAFYGCTYMNELTLPATMLSIADNGFALCAKLQKMTVNALIPPTVDARTFEDVDRSIPVYVPAESLNLYQAAPVWQEFYIVPKEDAPTSVDNITTNAAVSKIIRNGQLIIVRDGKFYNAQGAEL